MAKYQLYRAKVFVSTILLKDLDESVSTPPEAETDPRFWQTWNAHVPASTVIKPTGIADYERRLNNQAAIVVPDGVKAGEDTKVIAEVIIQKELDDLSEGGLDIDPDPPTYLPGMDDPEVHLMMQGIIDKNGQPLSFTLPGGAIVKYYIGVRFSPVSTFAAIQMSARSAASIL